MRKKVQNALEESIREILRRKQIPVHDYFSGDRVRIGIVSDTHLGSLHERWDILNLAYKVFRKEGIDIVYHAGDLVDGENMYRGQEYELHKHGADAQVKYVVDVYPKFSGVTTYFITGSHDLSFWKRAGIDVGDRISERREDLKYLGRELSDILIGTPKKKVKLRLMHPGKGTAYAISYHPQKIAESITGGNKPNILVIGHYHKAEMLFYRNIYIIQPGCLQDQTPFMQRNFNAAHLGFWIVDFRIPHDGEVSRFRAEFFPYYK